MENFDFIAFVPELMVTIFHCGLNRVDYNLNQLTYFTRDRWTSSNPDGTTPRAYATDFANI